MSRTTKAVFPFKLTSARFRVEGAEGENSGARWGAEQLTAPATDGVGDGATIVGVANDVADGVATGVE
jgi:hypothetical protein